MGWMRRHGFFFLGVAAGLAVLAFGLDARAADPAERAPAPYLTTRAVSPAPMPAAAAAAATDTASSAAPASLLPSHVDQPVRRALMLVPQPIHLLPDTERVDRPGAVQRLVIESIGLDTEVIPLGVEQRDGVVRYETPDFVAGQYRGVNPGMGGNVVLAGHVGTRDDLRGHIFRDLGTIELGDRIEVATADASLVYVVSEIRHVVPTATEAMAQTGGERLTLITCSSCNVDCNRLVIVARPLDPPDAAEAGDAGV